MKLNARELREIPEEEIDKEFLEQERNPLYFILENIYDTYNIGGIFRLADALKVKKIYLCGETEIPPNPRIKKASIGTYKVVPWEYKKTAEEAIVEVQQQGVRVYAVEQDTTSVEYTKEAYQFPVALLMGNETYGVLPETLQKVDQIVEIPMWGINKSLNVIVSTAIVSYHIVTSTT
ncbi:RNA methyltransferase [Candidatus Roizmanbacteria bacterium]|nr:RNA methyltransferase [Candidatus Roizmanbacteria bacterium]